MDTEIQKRVDETAVAEYEALVSAYDNDQLSEYLEELESEGAIEIKCAINGEMQNYEYLLCGGGPTAVMDYDTIKVSWGIHNVCKSIPRHIADKIWDMTKCRFETLSEIRMSKRD